MPDERGSAPKATCASCGKVPLSPVPEEVEAEPITHCEWCGAEYPSPEADAAPGAPGTPAT
jgi:hypothetical protein